MFAGLAGRTGPGHTLALSDWSDPIPPDKSNHQAGLILVASDWSDNVNDLSGLPDQAPKTIGLAHLPEIIVVSDWAHQNTV